MALLSLGHALGKGVTGRNWRRREPVSESRQEAPQRRQENEERRFFRLTEKKTAVKVLGSRRVLSFVLLVCLVAMVVTAFFCRSRGLPLGLAAVAFLPAFFLGLVLEFYHGLLAGIEKGLSASMGRVLVFFVLFFASLLGYLLATSLLFASPMGLILFRLTTSKALVEAFRLLVFNLTFAFVLLRFAWGVLRKRRRGSFF